MAPSARVWSGSETTSSGSTSIRVPRPVQSGHAPHGELNENDRGSSSSNDKSSSRHARCSENIRSRCGSSSARSTKSSSTTPPDRDSAVSTESVSLRRASGLTASRSTTTSMVCCSFLCRAGVSSSRMHGAVDPGPGVALELQFAEQFGVLALTAPDHRRQHLEPGPLRQLQHPVHDLLRRLPRDRPPAHRAMRPPHPRIQQPQVVIHLRDRPHRQPRIPRRRLLVNRHRRTQPVDKIHIRLVHLTQELPRIRRQRLHIPPLPLRENRVKRQTRLPRPRQPGKHDHGIPRQLQRHILQVVLASPTDDDSFSHRRSALQW